MTSEPHKVKTDRNGVAMYGYDPVSYFSSSGPEKGSSSHHHEWNGATWYFASDRNREAFAADPESYAPQFGGHCAFGKTMGMTVKGSPKRWMILDDRLYLNKNLVAQKAAPLVTERIKRLAGGR